MTPRCSMSAMIALPLMLLTGCATQNASQGDLDAAWAGVALPGSHAGKDTAGRGSGRLTSGGVAQTYPDTAVASLLPGGVHDPKGWTRDIMTAFTALQIPATKENLCAAMAVIAQESSFQAEPVVAGLPRIIQAELEKRRDQFHVPNAVMEAALAVKSPNGQTYRERIQKLRTENDLNRLYDDMISELPLGKTLLGNRNPVKTGGPMQVSLAFAEQKFKAAPYPYSDPRSLREEVFSRRGGLYFGIAYLLDYQAAYDHMLYRFADYNAGHYASRNAGLQRAIGSLSGQSLSLDGDLLRYEGERPSRTASETLNAVLSIKDLLGLSEEAIREDLAREKTPELEGTLTWQRIAELSKARGKTPPRPQLPEIKLISPKITSGLTTAGFARKVESRFGQCLSRSGN
ncbi:MAG: hypothetical protein RLZZ627_824 [Pseudomonadota bacterium]